MKRITGILSFISGIVWIAGSMYIITNTSAYITGIALLIISLSYIAVLKVTKFWSNEITGSWNNQILGLITLIGCIFYLYLTTAIIEHDIFNDTKGTIILIVIALSIITQGLYFQINYKKRTEKIKR
jgi:hypothetical protein